MNQEIIKEISLSLGVKEHQVTSTLNLLEDGNTIPFIARYRKEMTSNLDEEQIRSIAEVYQYQVNLLKRKEDIIRLIEEKEMMTDELKKEIMNATKLVEVEDLYRPFKEKKKTKATEAIKNGLEGLAKTILEFNDININELALSYLNDAIKTTDEAIEGALHIISEQISDVPQYRKWLRTNIYLFGTISSKLKKGAIDEKSTYEMYYDYEEKVKTIKPHRVLALNRGEEEKVLIVSINFDEEKALKYLEEKTIKNKDSKSALLVKKAIKDSYKRLIFPSVEREIRALIKDESEIVAIDNFGKNLEKLLLQPPLKDKMILALDPAFRTGCKLAVIDFTGKKIDIKVIYPHEPKNEIEKSKEVVLSLIKKYNIDIIAIGNGTASRESENFIANVIKEANKKVEYIIVNEAGASVYSASKLAIEEFPELHVEERSAISIGRRLQDPLAELVKIDPKSIGVGLYQHDVSHKNLSEKLDFVVTKAVNLVGVNVNTASFSLLSYVSGMNKKSIEKLLEYRNLHGRIATRDEIKKKKLLGDKAYEQAIGFLRITDGDNLLDMTDIHPESYKKTQELLKEMGLTIKDLGSEELSTKLDNVNIEEISKKLEIDKYTLEDIIKSLKKPARDPRDSMDRPLLKSDVLKIEDLKKGMKLQGTVRNVVDFGVFIDIGIKNDGLAHISKLTNKFIKHPSEILSVGDIVDCYVDEVFIDKGKVALSLLGK